MSQILIGMEKPILKSSGYAVGKILEIFSEIPGGAARVRVSHFVGFPRPQDRKIIEANLENSEVIVKFDELTLREKAEEAGNE